MEHLQSIQKIFQDQLFTIPNYQRGYAWEEQQWQDLIDDLELLENGQEHYTGTLVIHSSSDKRISDSNGDDYLQYDVVDGQQRLTTISVLINEMISQFEQLGESTLAASMRTRYIATVKNGTALPKLTLNRDTNEFYKSNIISVENDISKTPSIMSEQRLADAKDFFKSYFEKNKVNKDKKYLDWLNDMRTKIISQMKLTVYVVPKASDVGIIFEVMNNRGKTLTAMEKVKNYLLYVCAKLLNDGGEELAEEINNAWKYIYETIMGCGGFGWMEDSLLRFNWIMSQNHRTKDWEGSNSIKAKYNLKDYVGRHDELRDEIRAYVSLLRKSCKAFCDIYVPSRDKAFDDITDLKIRKKIIEFSNKLTRMNTTATFTPILMAIRLKNTNDADTYFNFLMLCEKYAFRIFRMLGKRANAGQASLYKTGYDYYNGNVTEETAYNNIRQTLTHFCPQRDYEARVDEVGNWYDWYGLKYLLHEYELHLANKSVVHLDWEVFQKKDKKDTIEHILPQKPDKPYWEKRWEKEQIDEATHDIGNLVVTLDNSSYSNNGFDIKKGVPGDGICYANSSLFSERQLANYEDWNYETFNKRREILSNWMKERWFIEDYRNEVAELLEDDDE